MELSPLSVMLERQKPTVKVHPAESVFIGERVTLTCEIRSGDWDYSWYKNNLPVSVTQRMKEYQISVKPSDAGVYTCKGTQSSGRMYTHTSDAVTLTVSERQKPTVKVQPAESVFIGERVTLTCETGGGDYWNYEWYKNTQSLRGSVMKDYIISNVGQSDAGVYTCKGTSGQIYTHTSDAVTLTVSERQKPTVKVQPAESVFIGERVTLTCETGGGYDWKYEWYKNTQSLRGSVRKDYIISNVGQSDAGVYTCKGTSGQIYTHTSDAVTLTVSERQNPTVKVHPAESVFIGERVTLTCEIRSGVWDYNWYKNNLPVSVTQRMKEYQISVKPFDAGVYTCKGTSGRIYTHTSDAVTLTVSERQKPTVKVQPAESVFIGERVTLTCETGGGYDWNYEWNKNNQVLRSFSRKEYTIGNIERQKPTVKVQPAESVFIGERVTLTCETGGGDHWKYEWYKNTQSLRSSVRKDYIISNVGQSDAGVYTCKGTQSSGRIYTHTSDTLTLTVSERQKPTVKVQPAESVFIGERVTLTCETGGGYDWNYEWNKNNQVLRSFSRKKYTIGNIGQSDAGVYTCKGTSGQIYTHTSDTVTLTVSGEQNPTVKVHPAESVFIGERVTLTCEIRRGVWDYNWYKNNLPVSVTQRMKEYHISVKPFDAGVYTCEGTSGRTQTHTSDAVTLTVSERQKPTVKVQPVESVFIGERVTLTCETGGGYDWNYEWYKNTQSLRGSVRKEYTISNVGQSDAGVYTCKGTQSSGRIYTHTSDAVTLTVSDKPHPTLTSSLKVAVLTGNTVTLYCILGPSTGWTFYWSKHTQNPENNSRTYNYTIRSVRLSEGGRYWCRAGRGDPVYYTHYSDALWVNVTDNPKAILSIKPDKQVFKGETVTLRCDILAVGDTEWTYSWFKDDGFYLSSGTQENTIHSVTESNSSKYTCRGEMKNQNSEISDAVTLTVSGVVQAVLSVSPQSWLTEGGSVILNCEVPGSAADWTFSWYRAVPLRQGLTPVTDAHGTVMYYEELLSDSRRGAGGSYTLSPAALNHTGVYVCGAERGEPLYRTQHSRPHPLWITGKSPPVSLIISPSRTQHFSTDSLSLSCEGQRDSTGWRVKRYTQNKMSNCSTDTGFTCNISSLSTSYTGVYWCQSESGEGSDPVNVTVYNGDVILESPVHPVTEGDPLTLLCLFRSTKSSPLPVDFYKNGSLLQNQTTGEMTIHEVSRSDEGLYHCKHPEKGESPQSWISVREMTEEFSVEAISFLGHVLATSPFVIISVVLAVKCCRF
ncbi:Fc receptor-like protein 5 [Hoplias malabaricus]|uniref:Fc receptor-like protein 5 n=1 Tax=Hoplias malabaricus TaxID=27720 RepID=UPI003461D1FD